MSNNKIYEYPLSVDDVIEIAQGIKAGRVLQTNPSGSSPPCWRTSSNSRDNLLIGASFEYRFKPEPIVRFAVVNIRTNIVHRLFSTKQQAEDFKEGCIVPSHHLVLKLIEEQ